MSGILDWFFGTSPKAVQEPNVNVTTDPQQTALNSALDRLQGLNPPANNALQTGASNGLQGLLSRLLTSGGGSGEDSGATTGAPSSTMPSFTASGAPTSISTDASGNAVVGGTTTNATSIFNNLLKGAGNAQTIDPTSFNVGTGATAISPAASNAAFQTGVAQPLTEDFTRYTLPGIAGKFGAGAGGAFSSDALHARMQAGSDLERNLASEGAKYSLATQTANQQAATDLNKANIASSTNLAATNQGTQISNASNLAKLLGLAPDVSTLNAKSNALQVDTSSQMAKLLESIFTTGQSDTQTPFNNNLDILKLLLSGGTTPTVQMGNTVALPGSPGFLNTVISAVGGAAGKAI